MNFPQAFPVLATQRLVLRDVDDRDVEAIFEMESDPVAMRYWSRPPMRDRSEAVAAVARARQFFPSRSALRWAITLRDDDRALGHVSLFGFVEASNRAELGYGLARRHWGQGYMHEALVAVVDCAFGDLGLRRLEADVDPRNLASIRAVERLGFRREGWLRERWQVGEEISDSALFGLLARDWAARER
ncbi:MAG: GNAT family N-acetyltransferase [Deltaproteobacteria bacterium]|nr:GNAT family N-acetyltransferase [Deltaproteobacteria bacterium]